MSEPRLTRRASKCERSRCGSRLTGGHGRIVLRHGLSSRPNFISRKRRGNAMNRRQFLNSAAAAVLAAPALLRDARAQEGPFRMKYYPVAAGIGPHDVTPGPDGT